MLCPECKRRIADIAESCKCGWTKGNVAAGRYVHCAYEDCGIGALARVKTVTGWANFCAEHYEKYFSDEAKHYCLTRGLDTVEKQYKFVRANVGNINKLAA